VTKEKLIDRFIVGLTNVDSGRENLSGQQIR